MARTSAVGKAVNAPRGRDPFEATGYFLSLAGLVGMIIGIHFSLYGVGVAGIIALIVGVVLNVWGETRGSRGGTK